MDIAFALPEVDAEGYLVNPEDWSEEVAETFARQENLQLSADHWEVLRFIREEFEENQIIPDVRHVIKHLSAHMGNDARKRVFEMFPYGYVKQACRIAGMRRPRAWSTG